MVDELGIRGTTRPPNAVGVSSNSNIRSPNCAEIGGDSSGGGRTSSFLSTASEAGAFGYSAAGTGNDLRLSGTNRGLTVRALTHVNYAPRSSTQGSASCSDLGANAGWLTLEGGGTSLNRNTGVPTARSIVAV